MTAAPAGCIRSASLAALLLAATLPGTAGATDQVPHEARGHERSGYALSDYENINLANGNLTFQVPLASVRTDGGLEWQLALHHNSKVWFTHRYCSLVPAGYDSCEGSGGQIVIATIAHGIEAFGFGWDLRPPRILMRRSAPFARETTFVDATGASHRVGGAPPWGGEAGPGTESGSEWSVGDRFYTRDGSNLRFTVTAADGVGRALEVEMEDGHGDVYRFRHVVPRSCDASGSPTPGDVDLEPFNFRIDVAGLYLSEIERGPWSAQGPANRIWFQYAGPSAGWDDVCPSARSWLPTRVTGSGEVERSVEIEYDPVSGAATRLWIPVFNPVIGDHQASSSREEVVLSSDLRSFDQRNGSHSSSVTARHLTGVVFPDGAEFRFDDLLPPGGAPLSDVQLPSGARVEYGQGPFPVGRARCEDNLDDGGDCTFWLTCGTRVPRIDEETSRVLTSDGVTSRSITYRDASTGAGDARRRTTWFMQGLNCAVSPHFTGPDGELEPWPYDFDWALRDDAGLDHPEYLWTVVSTSAGWGGPGSRGIAEIHRFHPLTREEFSVDVVVGDDDDLAGLPLMALAGVERLAGPGLRVIRHTQIERALRFGANYPSVTEGGDRYSYVRERRVLTDEASGDSSVADVEACAPPVFADPTGPPQVTADCAEVRETNQVDRYLNPVARALVSLRSLSGLEVSRTWEHQYRDHDAESSWFLHREIGSLVCERGDCSERARSWVNLSGPGARPWFAPEQEVANPDAEGGCTGDCIAWSYGYDELGNRELAAVTGGYGLGFGAVALATRIEHRHGRQVRKMLESGGDSLLEWEREVDPGTGWIRWHLGADGVGFAYGYDGVGRPTAIAPVEGDLVADDWELDVQRLDSGETMLGRDLQRILPDPWGLLRHELRDAVYRLAPAGSGVRLASLSVDPDPSVAVEFDGLGRPSRWTERYPSGSGRRSRIELEQFAAGSEVCGVDTAPASAPTARLTLASEWRDDADWTACDQLDWSESWLDPLGRPVLMAQPDGSESWLGYVGDRQTTVLRSVATDPAGGEQWLATTRIEDALGRLRVLEEELRSGVAYAADYGYDQRDRLVEARLWEGTPGASAAQVRGWSYSEGGFLTAAAEPERITSYLGWDAVGNLRTSISGGHRADVEHDGFGRRTRTQIDGTVAVSWLWGDARAPNSAAVGEPDYGKVVEATRHNRFGSRDVRVTSAWIHNGPGARISGRASFVGGLGAGDHGFEVGYGYDRWGNVAQIDHPVWRPWPAGCQDPVREDRLSEGSWLLGSEGHVVGAAAPVAGTRRGYHASGRVADVTYLAEGGTVGQLLEMPDANGMPRPSRLELWWTEGPGESLLRWLEGPFSYDGSGNLSRIGNRRYAYDGLDRLTEFREGGLPVEAYGWDRWGNLAELLNTDVAHGGGFTLRLLGSADDNRPETMGIPGIGSGSLGWSLRGNLTSVPAVGQIRAKRIAFSGDDRLLEAEDVASGVTWRLAYDAAGERVASWRRDGGGELSEVRIHLRDESGQLLSEWMLLPGSDFGPRRDYVRTGDRVAAQLDWVGGEPTARFLAHDHLGSARVVIEPDGTMTDQLEYYPFGGLRSGGPVPGTRLLFTGHERDLGATSSELDSMHARHFSPILARFVSTDLVGGDPTSSQSWNRYTYTRGNPLRAVDPTGLYEQDVHRGLTAVLAIAVGFDESMAHAIAEADQSVDDHPATSAFAGRQARMDFHFTSKARRDDLWAAFAASPTPDRLGVNLHALQDSFSHSEYEPAVGHLLAGHAPDKTFNDPGKADRMAATTYVELVAAGEIMGLDPDARIPFAAISELVQQFNDARTDQAKADIILQMKRLVTEVAGSSQD